MMPTETPWNFDTLCTITYYQATPEGHKAKSPGGPSTDIPDHTGICTASNGVEGLLEVDVCDFSAQALVDAEVVEHVFLPLCLEGPFDMKSLCKQQAW